MKDKMDEICARLEALEKLAGGGFKATKPGSGMDNSKEYDEAEKEAPGVSSMNDKKAMVKAMMSKKYKG